MKSWARTFFSWPILSTSLLLAGASLAHADRLAWPVLDSPKHWLVDNDSFQLNFDLHYLDTDRNFDANGNRVRPDTFAGANALSGRIHAGFPLGNSFSLFAQTQIRRTEDTVVATTAVPASVARRTGLGDSFIALRYLLASNRLAGGRFATASVIDPGVIRVLLESGLNIPPYADSAPPLGDRALDWQSSLRFAWYPMSWLSLSAGGGYTWRSGGYNPELPFDGRADILFPGKARARAWLGARGHEAIGSSGFTHARLASGSQLFGINKSSRTALFAGAAFLPGKSWEVGAEFASGLRGKNSWSGWEGALSLSYRPPAESTVGFYNPRRDLDIGGLARPAGFDGYDLRAPIIDVGKRGRFFKIGYGVADGVQIEEQFHVYENARLTKDGQESETYLGSGFVAAVKPHEAVIQLKVLNGSKNVRPGMEARRVKKKDDEGIRRLSP